MAQQPTRHPVYRAIHKPLLVGPVDRRFFLLALLAGVFTFNLVLSLVAGLLVGFAIFLFGWWATATDQQMLTILMSSADRYRRQPARFRWTQPTRYDPMKRDSRW